MWQIETDRGVKVLYRLPQGRERLTVMHAVLEQMAEGGLRRTNRLIHTRHGAPLVTDGLDGYGLVDWLPGRPADLTNRDELQLVAGALGDVHRIGATGGIGRPARDCDFWLAGIDEHGLGRSFTLYRSLALAPTAAAAQGDFGRFFLAYATEFEQKMRYGLACFDEQEVTQLVAAARSSGQVGHGDWREEHLLIDERGRLAIIGWKKCGWLLPSVELAEFLRYLAMRTGGWSADAAQAALAAYQERRVLALEEKRLLIALLRLPVEFWSTVAGYYRYGYEKMAMIAALKQAVAQEAERSLYRKALAEYLQIEEGGDGRYGVAL